MVRSLEGSAQPNQIANSYKNYHKEECLSVCHGSVKPRAVHAGARYRNMVEPVHKITTALSAALS
jgi:hypothetical protein